MATDIVERIGKILNQAENASNEVEAETFMEMATLLASRYDIDLAAARKKIQEKQAVPQPVARTITIGGKGDRNLASFAALMVTIARVYGLRSIIAGNHYTVTLIGMDDTIQLVELTYGSLAFQMKQRGDEYIRTGRYKEAHPGVNHQVARGEFYRGFIAGQERYLQEAHDRAEREAQREDSGTALVLRSRSTEIGYLYRDEAERHNVRGSFRPQHTSGTSYSSRRSGAQEGARARAEGHRGIGGHRTQIDG